MKKQSAIVAAIFIGLPIISHAEYLAVESVNVQTIENMAAGFEGRDARHVNDIEILHSKPSVADVSEADLYRYAADSDRVLVYSDGSTTGTTGSTYVSSKCLLEHEKYICIKLHNRVQKEIEKYQQAYDNWNKMAPSLGGVASDPPQWWVESKTKQITEDCKQLKKSVHSDKLKENIEQQCEEDRKQATSNGHIWPDWTNSHSHFPVTGTMKAFKVRTPMGGQLLDAVLQSGKVEENIRYLKHHCKHFQQTVLAYGAFKPKDGFNGSRRNVFLINDCQEVYFKPLQHLCKNGSCYESYNFNDLPAKYSYLKRDIRAKVKHMIKMGLLHSESEYNRVILYRNYLSRTNRGFKPSFVTLANTVEERCYNEYTCRAEVASWFLNPHKLSYQRLEGPNAKPEFNTKMKEVPQWVINRFHAFRGNINPVWIRAAWKYIKKRGYNDWGKWFRRHHYLPGTRSVKDMQYNYELDFRATSNQARWDRFLDIQMPDMPYYDVKHKGNPEGYGMFGTYTKGAAEMYYREMIRRAEDKIITWKQVDRYLDVEKDHYPTPEELVRQKHPELVIDK